MSKTVNVSNWSDSILTWIIAISIAVILFNGEPDVGDAIRAWAVDAAGLSITPDTGEAE